jgi:murein tripeptide amidase MpaA
MTKLHSFLAFILLSVAATAQNSAAQTTGKSGDASPQSWATPAEAADYRTTPRFDETMAYLRRLQQAAPKILKIEVFCKSGEGRDLVAVIASRNGVFDPAALHRANRPIVLIQNAIHAGEMDGKDSCLALLRDIVITKSKAALLDKAVLVILPVYNVDGHERVGRYNRINQNGPEEMGWRTTSVNLNLNRDYVKADAVETRAFLRLWTRWLPDFFVDDHVTDGADFQYDTTYNISTGPDVYPPLAEWHTTSLLPYTEQSVKKSGHVIGRYIATAVLSRDYPAIQGSLLVLVAMVMAANFVVDALHFALNPKLRR